MQLKFKTLFVLLAIILLPFYSYGAKSRVFAGDIKIGTLGIGAEAGISFGKKKNFVLRGGPNYLVYDIEETIKGIDYDIESTFINFSVLLDWHVRKSGFRLTSGLFVNGDSIDIFSTPQTPVTIGDNVYSPAEIGKIDGEIETSIIAPYIGLGWDHTFGTGSVWSLNTDAGLKYNGSPDVSLKTNGTLVNDATLQSDLNKEEDVVADDLTLFEFYPVFSIGFTYRF